MRKRRYELVLVCLAVVVTVLVGAASAKTWYVDDDGGPGIDFTKIQQAVDAASDDDTIFVYSGTYNEQVIVNKKLTLTGIEMPFVNSESIMLHDLLGAIAITADRCTIDGFKVTGGMPHWSYGIEVKSDYNIISNNVIFSNTGNGITLGDSSNNLILNNTISDNDGGCIGLYGSSDNNTLLNNTVSNSDDGIIVMSSSNNTIKSNYVVSIGWGGIVLYASYNTIINNNLSNSAINLEGNSSYNIITNNTLSGDSISVDDSLYNIISNNTVCYNDGEDGDGIELENSSHNSIINNDIYNNYDEGIELDGASHNTITNNTIYSNAEVGINVRGSLYNYIANNTIYSNGDAGIDLCRSWDAEPVVWGSSHNTITSNLIYLNGEDGMKLKNSSNNIITNNIVYANDDIGICTKNSSDNQIYNNNLIDNDEQAYDDANNNSWDKGPIIGGNYWSDHECTGNPSNGSQPYYIDSDSIDHYPFEDPIGELPPLPPPVPKTDVFVDKTEKLYTSDTYIDHNQTYNFDIEWYAGVWDVKNLDNVTYTITTPIDLTYICTWEFYQNGSETCSALPFSHTGENYTWILPLKDRFASSIDFYLPEKTIQDNPWADMAVNTRDEDGYTRINVTFILRIPSASVDLTIRGKIIDFSYPPEFEEGEFFPDYSITFYGDWEDLNQDQSYNFSILVDDPKEVELWLDKTHGWDTKYSNTLTLPVSELGSVTVAYDVPVKWGYGSTQPQYTQSIYITIEFEEKKVFDTDAGSYPSIMGTHKGTIKPSHDITVNKMYTYPCAGTGGHTEYVRIYGHGLNESATWKGYQSGDYHYITFDDPFTLKANVTYNYTIITGSYPQIHHNRTLTVPDGQITCSEFVDANGRRYDDWIPAIKLE